MVRCPICTRRSPDRRWASPECPELVRRPAAIREVLSPFLPVS